MGVAALSGPVDPAVLDTGLDAVRELGFEPVEARNLRSRSGLFAGNDSERLEAFHELVADESVKAVFFARGGHGILRLLDGIDWDLLARRPKAYVGYSDLTPLLNAIPRRLGIAAFHGPMVAADLSRGLTPEEEASLLGSLGGEPPQARPLRWQGTPPEGQAPVRGPLLGGCLSLITALLETPHALAFDDSILFWEDIEEPLYRLDRMLTHLRLSGRLAAIRGMLVGCIEPVHGEAEDSLDLLLAELGERIGRPVACGMPSGHCRPNLTIPLGLDAELDPVRGEVTYGLPNEAR